MIVRNKIIAINSWNNIAKESKTIRRLEAAYVRTVSNVIATTEFVLGNPVDIQPNKLYRQPDSKTAVPNKS